MMKIHEIMVSAILPAIKAAGKLEMENAGWIKKQKPFITTIYNNLNFIE